MKHLHNRQEMRDYILVNYSLTREGDEWVARGNGHVAPYNEYRHVDRDNVVCWARGMWGHFNFIVEAEAFDTIFTFN